MCINHFFLDLYVPTRAYLINHSDNDQGTIQNYNMHIALKIKYARHPHRVPVKKKMAL